MTLTKMLKYVIKISAAAFCVILTSQYVVVLYYGDTKHCQGDTNHFQGDTIRVQGETKRFHGDNMGYHGNNMNYQGDTQSGGQQRKTSKEGM